jgi:DNA-binding MarR family transcriptional regulator
VVKHTKPTPEGLESDVELDGTLEFMRMFWQIAHGLESTSKRMSRTLAVTGPQRLVIRILGQFEELSAGQLARVMCVHPSTLTGVLRRLEERSLIARRRDPEDGRRALFGLTNRGRQIDAVKSGTVEAVVRRVLARASTRQLEAAKALLRQLGEELGPAEPGRARAAPAAKSARQSKRERSGRR